MNNKIKIGDEIIDLDEVEQILVAAQDYVTVRYKELPDGSTPEPRVVTGQAGRNLAAWLTDVILGRSAFN